MCGRLFPRPRLVALFRSAAYSPLHHAANDTAILEATVSELERLGWSARRFSERNIVIRPLPPADLYLNMCQGPAASQALLEPAAMGHRFLNRPSSVLGCHRHRLVPALAASGIPFPATLLLSTEESLTRIQRAELASLGPGPLWTWWTPERCVRSPSGRPRACAWTSSAVTSSSPRIAAPCWST
jgi:hypothetical protein